MRQYDDNDIEVLGGESTPKKGKTAMKWFIAGVIIAAVAIAVAVYLLTRADDAGNDTTFDGEVIIEEETVEVAYVDIDSVSVLPAEFTDSINDVAFTVVSLEGCKAAVTFERPNSTDRDILLALPAADIRADNGEIVGEFIHNRQQLSRGVRKQGFCYISPKGDITIGVGDGESQKKSALDDGGTFFRQYSLVMNGEIQPNVLKGKAERRALAILHGKPTIVISKNRESVYDFSQALADYGFSHAIYLPGGKGFIKMHTEQTNLYAHDYSNGKYRNYLIFKH